MTTTYHGVTITEIEAPPIEPIKSILGELHRHKMERAFEQSHRNFIQAQQEERHKITTNKEALNELGQEIPKKAFIVHKTIAMKIGLLSP